MVHMTLDEVEKLKKDHLTVNEVSSVLGISSHAFYKYYNSFPFPILKIGKRYKIPKKPFSYFNFVFPAIFLPGFTSVFSAVNITL